MKKGLTQRTFAVLGAALLSGSVFAAGPTLDGIPSLLITDKAAESDVTLNPSTPYDGGTVGGVDILTGATENRYRFTPPPNTQSFTNPEGLPGSSISYLFTIDDYQITGADPGGLVVEDSIEINQDQAFAGTVSSELDVLSNAAANIGYDTNNLLDFVNVYRSGSSDPGSNTGPDPGGQFFDTATLTMYVASGDATADSFDAFSFNVYTTNDPASEGDIFTDPTAPTVPTIPTVPYTVVLQQDVFDGWNLKSRIPNGDPNNDLIDYTNRVFTTSERWETNTNPVTTPAFGTLTSVTNSLGGTSFVAPAATNALGGETDAAPGTQNAPYAFQQVAWGNWSRNLPSFDQSFSVTAGEAYLLRWSVTGTGVAGESPTVRFIVGDPSGYGFGVIKDEIGQPGGNAITSGPVTHRQYIAPRVDAQVGLSFDVFDLWQNGATGAIATSDYTLSVDSVDIYAFDRADLGTGTVVWNQGETPTVDDATLDALPAGVGTPDDFNTPAWTHGEAYILDSSATPSRFTSTGSTASQLHLNVSTSIETVVGSFTPGQANEILVDGNDIVWADFWVSSPSNTNLPFVRVGLQTSFADVTGDGVATDDQVDFAGLTNWNEWIGGVEYADLIDNDGNVVDSIKALTAAPRKYSVIMEPQLRNEWATSGVQVPIRPEFQSYATPIDTDGNLANVEFLTRGSGKMILHRVVITTYDLPTWVTDLEN